MKRGLTILCLFTIGLAITAILMTLFVRIIPTVTITGETYIGLIVSFLGLLITFVVGFQIYNVMDFKERIKDVESQKDDLTTKNEAFKEEYRKKLDELERASNEIQDRLYKTNADIFNLLGVTHAATGNYLFAVDLFIECFWYSLRYKSNDNAKLNLDLAFKTLQQITADKYETQFEFCITGNDNSSLQEHILKTMENIDSEFKTKEIYRPFSQRFGDTAKLLKKKIEQYEKIKEKK